jgi:DNA polymerase III delta prime subunit
MSFDLKHLPRSFGDLVIADPNDAAIIHSYVTGPPAKPLLLAGPPGAGKTEAARVIAQSYFASRNCESHRWEYNGASFTKSFEDVLMAEANIQKMGTRDKALILINEIDLMDLRTVQPLFRQFMDDKRHLFHFIATTNYPSQLMGAMLNRFRMVGLKLPSPLDWVPRAKAILETEGLRPTLSDVQQMLANFQGSARDLIDLLEETVIASQQLHQMSLPAATQGAAP